MSAKRARKPLAEINQNHKERDDPDRPLSKRQKKDNSILSDPESFEPLEYVENSCEPNIPDAMLNDPDFGPKLFFDLFWDKEILNQLVNATNSYAKIKRPQTKRQWSRPITVSELRVFLGITIMMGVVRVPCVRRYWTFRILSAITSDNNGTTTRPSMSSIRYYQIRRYLHISMPEYPSTVKVPHRNWWKKMEPLSSHLRTWSQELYTPSTHVSVDEMMIPFTGRSQHTVRIPSKPIPVGYKILALCDSGYTVNWLFTFRTESIAELIRHPSLSPTSSAVLQLCDCLDSRNLDHIVYMDNAFSTIPLFRRLRELSIGACGTTRVNSVEYPSKMKNDTSLTNWNSMDGVAVGNPAVLCVRWIDNNIVRILTTVHPWNERTLRERRKPRNTSTNATTVRKAFGGKERKSFYIPTFIDDYNQHMNGVDLADQRRAQYSTHQRARRNWLPFFFAFLDISISNTYILFLLARTKQLNLLLDSKQISPEIVREHPLGRPYSAELFRRVLYKQLTVTNPDNFNSTPVLKAKSKALRRFKYRSRTRESRQLSTQRVYFTKGTNLKTARTGFYIINRVRTSSISNHDLNRLKKRRECAICRYDFRSNNLNSTPIQTGRRRPKLTQYECTACFPPTALCGPI